MVEMLFFLILIISKIDTFSQLFLYPRTKWSCMLIVGRSVYSSKGKRWYQVMKISLFQIDFNTNTIFNIEKGTLKKKFPFSQVKSYEDGEGKHFNIAFHGRPDYILETVSFEDKRKVSCYML